MKDVEATFIGYRSRGAEMVLSFAIQRDDLGKTKDLVEMIGHAFRLDIEKIDYDNPQPAQEGQQRHEPARVKLHARVGILSKDQDFAVWAAVHHPEYFQDFDVKMLDREAIGAIAVRAGSKVKSRGEILPGTEAELRFNLLESAYRASYLRKA